VFNAVSQEWVDVGHVSSTAGARMLVDIGSSIQVSITGTISATIEASAIVTAVNEVNTTLSNTLSAINAIKAQSIFTSAGSNSNLNVGTAVTVVHAVSDSTYLNLRPRDGSIYWDWNSNVSVTSSYEILKNEPAIWNFDPGLTSTIFAISSATAVDVRKSVE